MTDNEIIAEFMGYKRSDFVWEDGEHAFTMKIPQAFNKMVIPSNMCYESSWDWLMPVVEKIFEVAPVNVKEINSEGLLIFEFGSIGVPIQEVYKAVVEFIKWYNEQRPSELRGALTPLRGISRG